MARLDDVAFQLLVESVVDNAVFRLDPDGKVVSWNRGAQRITGYEEGEILGRHCEAFETPEAQARGEPARELELARAVGRHEAEGWRVRKDGSCFWASVTTTPLLGRNSEILGFARVMGDLTERRRREAIEGSEAWLRAIIETAPDAIVVADEKGAIVLSNAQTQALFGYSAVELASQPIEILVPERLRSSHIEHRRSFFATPSVRAMGAGLELNGRRKDGTEFPLEVRLSPHRTRDGMFVTAAIRDVSDRRQTEQTLRASVVEKETLLREVHHRVKNNLQVIWSLLNLQRAAAPDVARGLFRASQDRVRSMALVYERLYQSHELSRVRLDDYLRNLVAEMRSSYAVCSETVETHVEAEELVVDADLTVRCGFIATELVSNCFKHAFPGGRQGRITVEARRLGKSSLELVVQDDGVGLPPGFDLSKIETLGLRLVRLLSEQLGGAVALTSAAGGGTRFELTFPLKDEDVR